jgi:predicted RNA binding protein YcfA (HicA-like mRNA interferase family)
MQSGGIIKDKRALLEELKQDMRNLRFERLCGIAEKFGFRFRGGKGSHRVFVRLGIREILTFQNVGGKAKPYQVRQLIKIIEEHRLDEEGEEHA